MGWIRRATGGIGVAIPAVGAAQAQGRRPPPPDAAAALRTQVTPVTLRVLQASLTPVPATDGLVHLAYAAQVTNVGRRTASLAGIVPTDPVRGLETSGTYSVLDMGGKNITAAGWPFDPGAGGGGPAGAAGTKELRGRGCRVVRGNRMKPRASRPPAALRARPAGTSGPGVTRGSGLVAASMTSEVMAPARAASYLRIMSQVASNFGPLLREWRQRRRISQLDLACQGNISTRHLSFLETGRSRPSRDMVLHLAEQLDVPLRERNQLLAAAGFAPVYRQSPLTDPGLRAARQAMEAVVHGHMPYPALAVDRHWTLVIANRAVATILADVDGALLAPPVNVLRLALHPAGLAPRTINLAAWRAHLLGRLHRQVEVSADPVLAALLAELRAYPVPRDARPARAATGAVDMVVPFELATAFGTMAFISMTAVFGTPMDITLSELAMECFYPANDATARMLLRERETHGG